MARVRKRKNNSAGLLTLIILFIASAFALLALSTEEIDIGAFLTAGILIALISAHYLIVTGLFPQVDRQLLIIVYVFVSVSMVMQYRINDEIASRQLIWIAIGMAGMLIMMILTAHPDFLRKLIWPLMVLSIILLMVVFLVGNTVGGAKNWINLAGFSFQPSEFIKIVVVLALAHYLSCMQNLRALIWPAGVFIVACMGILVLSRDLGAAVMYAAVTLILYYAATGNVFWTGAGVAVGCVAGVAAYNLFDHVKVRVAAWRNPFGSYESSGYQIAQGLMAIASGGLFGMGLTQGMPKLIPAYHTDYIFAVICEEMGIIIGICILILYIVFIVRGITHAMQCEDQFSSLIALGMTSTLGIQTFLIIGGVIKLIPLTGVTLPFISYGGSSMISSFLMLGALQSIAIANGKRAEER